jgi:hypothetical protein
VLAEETPAPPLSSDSTSTANSSKKKKRKDKSNIELYELEYVLKQKPNRKILGIWRFHLQAYNLPNPDKIPKRKAKNEAKLKKKNDRKKAKVDKRNKRRAEKGKPLKEFFEEPYEPTLSELLRETVGEAPVVYNDTLTRKSTKQLNLYLAKKGYFGNTVRDSVAYNEKKKTAKIYYFIEPGTPHKIRNIKYRVTESSMASAFQKYKRGETDKKTKKQFKRSQVEKLQLVEEGQNFDIDKLDEERDLLARFLMDQGYYFFVKNYIYYEADSTQTPYTIDLTMGISNVVEKVPGFDTTRVVPHMNYKINKVVFHINDTTFLDPSYRDYIDAGSKNLGAFDTLYYKDHEVYYNGKLEIDADLLIQSIFLTKDKYFKQKYVERSYKRFATLGMFKSVNITFEKNLEDPIGKTLNCIVYLTPSKKQSFTLESNGTNQGGNLGLSGNFTYSNKNTFGGAELLKLSVNGGLEAQRTLLEEEGDDESVIEGLNFLNAFNTLEFGSKISLNTPKLFIPFFSQEKVSRSAMPSTIFSSAINFQIRPDYKRRIANISMGYSWLETKTKTHYFSPLEISFIKIDKSSEFEEQLSEVNDQFLINSYQDHLTVQSKYTFTYNSQVPGNKSKNVIYYQGNAEFAGNLLRAGFNLSSAEPDTTGSYNIFNIPFAQFVKINNDFRYYRTINIASSAVFRVAGGVGIPLTNLSVLPFEKSFFSGGANSIRAWKARSLGPGSYFDPELSFDRIGDIQLEANIEYRFDLTSMLEGAFFVDAGNIWLIDEDENRIGSGFNDKDLNTLLGEVAIGAGIGIRLDLDFFIIRFDFALQVKDPGLDPGERWLFEGKDNYDSYIDNYNSTLPEGSTQLKHYGPVINLNLGIGYPF